MYIACIQVAVKPENREQFIEAMMKNVEGTRQEPGNVRFDFLQAEDDPNHFFIYEVFQNEEAFKAHQQTQHYLDWRETVADWMEEPRKGRRYHNIAPADSQWNE